MVSDVVQLENTITKHPDNDDECDAVSVASSAESRVECDGAVVLNNEQDRSPCFQNIEVTNSSDVHFGNKTYYQGPVTIKQILYSNPSQNSNEDSDQNLPISDICGKDNEGYVTDSANGVVKNGNIRNNTNHSNNVNWTIKTKGNKWLQSRTKKQLIIGTVVTMVAVLCVTAVIITLLTTQNKKQLNEYSGEELAVNVPNNDPEAIGNVALVSRPEWIAEPASKTAPLAQPVPTIFITETETKNCSSKAECIFVIRHLQTSHKEGLSFWDIKYNFLVGGDGNVYDGRGWNNVGASIPNCNKHSLGIAFVGKFTQISPPLQQVNAARRLIGMGVKLGHISINYKVVTASQILGSGTGSSEMLDESVKTWHHWSNVDYFHNENLKQELCN